MNHNVVLNSLEWDISRTGILSLVGFFDPIYIDGIYFDKVIIGDVETIKSLEIGVGDLVELSKDSYLNIRVTNNFTKSNTWTIPDRCPSCNAVLRYIDGVLFCTHKTCKAARAKKVSHYCSKDGMNISGISINIATKLVDNGYIKKLTDIYTLKNHKVKLKRFLGEISYKKLLDNIEKSKKTNLINFIFATGIANKRKGKPIVDYCKNDIDTFLSLCIIDFDWSEIHGITKDISDNINQYVKSNYDLLDDLSHILKIEPWLDEKENNGKLFGLKFVVTGMMEEFENRCDIITFIDGHGGKVYGEIDDDIDYLVNNNTDYKTSLINKTAKKYNIPIITEKDIKDMVLNGSEV